LSRTQQWTGDDAIQLRDVSLQRCRQRPTLGLTLRRQRPVFVILDAALAQRLRVRVADDVEIHEKILPLRFAARFIVSRETMKRARSCSMRAKPASPIIRNLSPIGPIMKIE
jgi:hypothetical protein